MSEFLITPETTLEELIEPEALIGVNDAPEWVAHTIAENLGQIVRIYAQIHNEVANSWDFYAMAKKAGFVVQYSVSTQGDTEPAIIINGAPWQFNPKGQSGLCQPASYLTAPNSKIKGVSHYALKPGPHKSNNKTCQ